MPQAVQMDFSGQSDLSGKFLEPRIQILFAVIVAIENLLYPYRDPAKMF